MSNYLDNRELSWLKFNERVLEEAMDVSNPLFERLGFFSIFQTNLDEFFMVRIGSLFELMNTKKGNVKKDELEMIFDKVRSLETRRDTAFSEILKDLSKNNIEYVDIKHLNNQDKDYLKKFFKREIKPFLVPLVLSKGNPFPFLNQKMLYIILNLEKKEKDKDEKNQTRVGVIPVDDNIVRFIQLPDSEKIRFILAEDVIMYFADSVFKNYTITSRSLLRIIRNADLDADEAYFDHDIDYREFMKDLIKRRKKQSPVRLQLSDVFDLSALEFLSEKLPLKLKEKQIFYTGVPLDFGFVGALRDLVKKPEFFYPKRTPQLPQMVNNYHTMFTQIRKNDIILSYPYESIRPFIKLLEEAAESKQVESVKITLYRLAKNSKIIDALVKAVENGKEVTVLVELRARFDEENNIGWSRKLQNAGCKVVYGPQHFKVHSKLLLITCRNSTGVEYFTQVGTGNYNEKTATLYTDYALLTHNQKIGKDAEKLFRLLTKDVTTTPAVSGFNGKYPNDNVNQIIENSKSVIKINETDENQTLSVLVPETTPEFKYLLVAPLNLRDKIIEYIDIEIKKGNEGYVAAKLNSLTDKLIIDKLVEASQAGVKVELLVRGVCCLIPKIKGFTENITVTSIVGRFLEHSRIYIFGKGFGQDEHGEQTGQKIYISSADYMSRNTIRRVEVAIPILNYELQFRILDMFEIMLNDDVKGRILQGNGQYVSKKNVKNINSQEFFIEESYRNARNGKI